MITSMTIVIVIMITITIYTAAVTMGGGGFFYVSRICSSLYEILAQSAETN